MATTTANPTSNSPNWFPSICRDAIEVLVIVEIIVCAANAVVAELIVEVVVE